MGREGELRGSSARRLGQDAVQAGEVGEDGGVGWGIEQGGAQPLVQQADETPERGRPISFGGEA
jgi:hypothetical protein